MSAPSTWPSVYGIDSSRADSAWGHDLAFFERLLRRFVTDAPRDLAQITAQLQAGQKQPAMAQLHKLRGMAGNIAAMRLYALASEMEALLREGQAVQPETMAVLASEFQNLIGSATQWLVSQQSTSESDNVNPLGVDERATVLRQIAELEGYLAAHSARAARHSRALMQMLANTPLTAEFANVHQCVEDFDFPAAMQALHVFQQSPLAREQLSAD